MDLDAFCRRSRVLVVVGKGGVGRTTVTAALAEVGAVAGLNVLLVALDTVGDIPRLFGSDTPLAYEEAVLLPVGPEGGMVRGRALLPDDALVEYLGERGLGRLSRRLAKTGALDVVATAIPGIGEILVLGKVKQLERAGEEDLIIIDAPASGHAVTLLTSASGVLDAARGGPLRTQASDVVELLSDPSRCEAVLVTTPEETPVNELVETAYRLEDEVGVSLGPIVVNCCYPPRALLDTDPFVAARDAGRPAPSRETARRLAAAAHFRTGRARLQAEQIERIGEELPLPQLPLPFIFGAEIGPDELGTLADALRAGIAELPDLSSPGRVR